MTRSIEGRHMKIASLETDIVLLPNDEPLAGFSENPNAKNPIVRLRLRTDDGIEGLGVAYFGGAMTQTLRHAVDELGALTIGDDPLRLEGDRREAARRGGLGRAGRHPDDGDVGDRRRAVGHQGQGARPAAVEAARRRARQDRHLCQRRAAPRPQARGGGDRRRAAARRRAIARPRCSSACPASPTRRARSSRPS